MVKARVEHAGEGFDATLTRQDIQIALGKLRLGWQHITLSLIGWKLHWEAEKLLGEQGGRVSVGAVCGGGLPGASTLLRVGQSVASHGLVGYPWVLLVLPLPLGTGLGVVKICIHERWRALDRSRIWGHEVADTEVGGCLGQLGLLGRLLLLRCGSLENFGWSQHLWIHR